MSTENIRGLAIQGSANELVSELHPRPICVFQDWMFALNLQQQSVLVLALRGPDGIEKHHPCKTLVKHYRASVLKNAVYGRAMKVGEHEERDSFQSLQHINDLNAWNSVVRKFFDSVDGLPHHYCMHLLHGAQIVGFKHPEAVFRDRWSMFYYLGCEDLHMIPEMEDQMDRRLSDWNHRYWDDPEKAQLGLYAGRATEVS